MMNEKWTPKLKKWLEEGKMRTDKIAQMPWDVALAEGEGSDHLVATLPSIPFSIEMFVGPEYANLYIDMRYPTDALDPVERMRLYKRLLNINKEFNMLKTSLMGEDDGIILSINLDLASLNEKEFDNALTAMVIGSSQLASQLGMSENIRNFMMSRTLYKIVEMLSEGKTKKEVMHYLLYRVGVDQDMANMFWDEVAKQKAPEAPGEDPAVGRYIR